MRNEVIRVRELNYQRFEQKIINSLDLSLFEGEFVILVGPNGSGKSTLLKILNGHIKPNSGYVSLDGKEILSMPVHKIARSIATLTQDLQHSTFSELSVRMNINLALSRKSAKRIDNLADYVGSFNSMLASKLDIPCGHLSGGQRQSLALAMCFAHTPRVLLLDEHTSALDPKAANALMARTYEHVRKNNLTTLMITHSLDHAIQFGDRILVIVEGKIVEDKRGAEKASLTRDQLINLAYEHSA